MLKVLVPVDDSSNSQHVVRHLLSELQSSPALDIHLLNVQSPFSNYVTRFFDETLLKEAHNEASAQALQPARQMLDEAGASYAVHCAVGNTATAIVDAARQLRCDHIVIGTTRKNVFIRAVEGSVTTRVLELTTVPVLAIATDPPSRIERYGVPVGAGAGLAWLVVAAAE